MRRARLWAALLAPALLLIVGLGFLPAAAAVQAQETPSADPALFRYFPETGHNIGVAVKQFYDAHGGVDIFGMPLTEVITDSSGLQVQYFERARFELHPEQPPEQYVTLTRLGAHFAQGREGEWAFQWLAASPDPARDFFPESGHTLGGAFRYFWQSRGGLEVFGYPISEEFSEVSPLDGSQRLVQYFERARFEYHPEAAGTPYEVQLSQLGRDYLAQQNLDPALTAPAAPITLIGSATTGFATSIAEREHNIARAAEMFHGVVVPPGAEYSFLNSGDFTEEGFVEGYAIVGGQLEKVVGGGLCQVSTTMFRAVSNAGMEITRRQGHSFVVYFYENILGFDATVYSPDLDFRWRNSTNYPVYFSTRTNVEAATVTFDVWGVSDGRVVTYDGPYTRNWRKPGTPIWEYDAKKPRGYISQLVHGRSGVDVTYHRLITWSDGTITRDTYYTSYQPWEDYYVFGPGVTPPAGVRVVR